MIANNPPFSPSSNARPNANRPLQVILRALSLPIITGYSRDDLSDGIE